MRDMGPVVVGIDDSSNSDLALRWGIEQARAQATTLRLVCAYRSVFPGPVEMGYEEPQIELQELRRHAHSKLSQACEQADVLAPGLVVESAAVEGDAVSVLLAESRHATVLVLGSRQLKTFGSVVLGSVAAAVSVRAQCPVIVLRAPAGDPAEDPAVIVGVDGTEDSETVLAFGFDYASRHRLPLKAVLCWNDHFTFGPWQHARRSFGHTPSRGCHRRWRAGGRSIPTSRCIPVSSATTRYPASSPARSGRACWWSAPGAGTRSLEPCSGRSVRACSTTRSARWQ